MSSNLPIYYPELSIALVEILDAVPADKLERGINFDWVVDQLVKTEFKFPEPGGQYSRRLFKNGQFNKTSIYRAINQTTKNCLIGYSVSMHEAAKKKNHFANKYFIFPSNKLPKKVVKEVADSFCDEIFCSDTIADLCPLWPWNKGITIGKVLSESHDKVESNSSRGGRSNNRVFYRKKNPLCIRALGLDDCLNELFRNETIPRSKADWFDVANGGCVHPIQSEFLLCKAMGWFSSFNFKNDGGVDAYTSNKVPVQIKIHKKPIDISSINQYYKHFIEHKDFIFACWNYTKTVWQMAYESFADPRIANIILLPLDIFLTHYLDHGTPRYQIYPYGFYCIVGIGRSAVFVPMGATDKEVSDLLHKQKQNTSITFGHREFGILYRWWSVTDPVDQVMHTDFLFGNLAREANGG